MSDLSGLPISGVEEAAVWPKGEIADADAATPRTPKLAEPAR